MRVQLAVGTSVLVVERISQNGRVERTLNTIGRMEKPPSRKGGEYRRSDVHASDPGDACGRRRGEEAYAPVAQRKERHPPEVGVAGSNPAGGTSGRMTEEIHAPRCSDRVHGRDV